MVLEYRNHSLHSVNISKYHGITYFFGNVLLSYHGFLQMFHGNLIFIFFAHDSIAIVLYYMFLDMFHGNVMLFFWTWHYMDSLSYIVYHGIPLSAFKLPRK